MDFSLVELTDEVLAQGKIITTASDGFLISEVKRESGAYGILAENDIITKFDGIKLGFEDRDNDGSFTGAADADPYDIVIEILSKKNAGDTVEVEYFRDGKTYTTSIVLVEKN